MGVQEYAANAPSRAHERTDRQSAVATLLCFPTPVAVSAAQHYRWVPQIPANGEHCEGTMARVGWYPQRPLNYAAMLITHDSHSPSRYTMREMKMNLYSPCFWKLYRLLSHSLATRPFAPSAEIPILLVLFQSSYMNFTSPLLLPAYPKPSLLIRSNRLPICLNPYCTSPINP